MRPDHTWSVSFDNLYVEDEVLIQLFNGHQNIILQFWIHCGFIHVCRLLARFISLGAMHSHRQNEFGFDQSRQTS